MLLGIKGKLLIIFLKNVHIYKCCIKERDFNESIQLNKKPEKKESSAHNKTTTQGMTTIMKDKEGSELDTLDLREFAKKEDKLKDSKVREDVDNDSIHQPNKLVQEIQAQANNNDSLNSSISSLTMEQMGFQEFDEEGIFAKSTPMNHKKFMFESTSIKAIGNKDLPLDEKKLKYKRAMNCNICHFIQSK